MRRADRYDRSLQTFRDAIAAIRHVFWRCPVSHASHANDHIAAPPDAAISHIANTLC